MPILCIRKYIRIYGLEGPKDINKSLSASKQGRNKTIVGCEYIEGSRKRFVQVFVGG